jgi:hypothetical protein
MRITPEANAFAFPLVNEYVNARQSVDLMDLNLACFTFVYHYSIALVEALLLSDDWDFEQYVPQQAFMLLLSLYKS